MNEPLQQLKKGGEGGEEEEKLEKNLVDPFACIQRWSLQPTI